MIIVKTRIQTFFSTMFLPVTQIIFHQAILMEILKISRKIQSLFYISTSGTLIKSFAELYISLSFNFSIICFSETWSNDENLCKNSLFQLESHSFLHKNRKYRRGGEKWKAIESLSTEISYNFLNTEGQSPHCISNFLDKLKW